MVAERMALRLFRTCLSEARVGRRAVYSLLALILASASLLLCWRGSLTSSWTTLDVEINRPRRGSGRNVVHRSAFKRSRMVAKSNSNRVQVAAPAPADLFEPDLLAVRAAGFGQRFRTQACLHALQLPESERWDAFLSGPSGPRDREVLNHLELAQVPEEGRPRVACIVYSTRSKRQLLRDSYAAWGQDCDAFLPFSDETWTDNVSGFRTIEVHPPKGPDNYHTIIAKMRMIFREVTRRLQAGKLAFDFLVVSGDDAFWILPNLRSYLRTFPTRGAGVYLGHRFAQNGNHRMIYASGAGYVINQIALRAYMNCSLPEQQSGFAEDVVMGVCLAAAGIQVWPTEDALGRQRFHFTGPADTAALDYANPPDKREQWISDYHRPWSQVMLTGIDGISKSSVLFHSVSGQRRYDMHDWLYHRVACKANATEAPAVSPPSN